MAASRRGVSALVAALRQFSAPASLVPAPLLASSPRTGLSSSLSSCQHPWTLLQQQHSQLATPPLTQPFAYAAAQQLAVKPEPIKDFWRVRVTTGNLRGAGSDFPAFIQLIGNNGGSDKVLIGHNEFDRFVRGSSRTFVVPAPKDVGTIRRVVIEQAKGQAEEPSSDGDVDSWYLQQVEVIAPSGDLMVFPCNTWIGDDKARMEVNLVPLTVPEHPLEGPVKVKAYGVAIPHPNKLKMGMKGANRKGAGHAGEDAYFYCEGRQGTFAMGVADGVYMWREQGIDSGKFSQALMDVSANCIAAGMDDVFAVLRTSANHVLSQGIQGSSTYCLLVVNRLTGLAHAANLGDSGFVVFSPNKTRGSEGGALEYEVKFRTNHLEHEFGCPYQLGHHAKSNRIEDADLTSFTVHGGDIIVMGSDGLFDNVSDAEMLEELNRVHSRWISTTSLTSSLAHYLVDLAFRNSMDRAKQTPYSWAASEAFNMVYNGGKKDDITVLVALCS